MANRVVETTLNGSTLDILNAIRTNASYEYQSLVPAITQATDIPKVGDIIYGHPGLANQFINALLNRIAFVLIKSATFNNPYSELKKGYLNFGETVEEVFIQMSKARTFDVEKAGAREFQRTLPDVKSAFHVMNYRVQYPITIQREDLKTAFLSESGITDMVGRIINAIYVAYEYDEYLLFKYAIIKAITHGHTKPIGVANASDIKNSAVAFRRYSNQLTFVSDEYNDAGVHTTTPKSDQYIFMDADFDAQFDVNVLASAFNMDKTDYLGRRLLIDSWTTFDNDRFDVIRAESDCLEEVTSDELALMANVVAILVDKEWFQFYDNELLMSETYVSSGLYWNYFYNVWKTISTSPFSNIITFVESTTATVTAPNSVTAKITGIETNSDGTIIYTLEIDDSDETLRGNNVKFIQTQDAVTKSVAVLPYGAVIVPSGVASVAVGAEVVGFDDTYSTATITTASAAIDDELTFTKQ